MRTSLQSTLVLCLTASTYALPASTPNPKQTFTINQNTTKPIRAPAPVALAAAYRKYKVTPPSKVAAAAAAALKKLDTAKDDGTVTAVPYAWDEEYLCSVTIGGQSLELDFDTGSADLWVFSSLLPANEQVGHSIYNPSKSKTARKLNGQSFSLTYGDGSQASGIVYQDTVNVGHTVATNQAVELATSVSSSFVSTVGADGLMGLGFDNLNYVRPNQQKTFFSTVSNNLVSPLFTADLKKGQPGSYDFGFIDTTKYKGAIFYANVDSSGGHWQFNSAGYAIGNNREVKTTINAIADTGTTLLLLPNNIVQAYYKSIAGSTFNNNYGAWTFPCTGNIPSFSLYIGSYKAVIPGNYMNFAPVGNNMCYGGLQSNQGLPFSILGDIFLKSQYVVFSKSPQRIGFASKSLVST